MGIRHTFVSGRPASNDASRVDGPKWDAEHDLSNFTAADVPFTQTGTGATARTALSKLKDSALSVKDFGALGDGTTNDAAAIQSALSAGDAQNKAVYFPSGTYIVSASLFLGDSVRIFGDGPFHSILKAANASNIPAIINCAANDFWQIVDLQIDGNSANNPTAGSGIFCNDAVHYLIQNVRIKNCKTRGLDLAGPDVAPTFGMEPTVTNVVIDTCGTDGFYYNGAHDGHFENIIVIDASQTTTDTSSGFVIDTAANGRWVNCHAWSRPASNRMKYAFDIASTGNQFLGCHMEGAFTANMHLTGSGNQFEACRWYAAWNGVNILLRSSLNKLSGVLEAPGSGRPACKGIVFGTGAGDNVSANFIDILAGTQEAGIIDFAFNDGRNTLYVRGFNAAGTNIVGVPDATDRYEIFIHGGAVTILANPIASTAFTPVANDGAALGTSSLMFSDLFLASGGVINMNNGDVTITHGANNLFFQGASSGYTMDAVLTIGASGAGLFMNTPAGSQQTFISLNDNGTNKWQLGKNTDNSFFYFDAARGANVINIPSNGDLALMPSGGNVGVGGVAVGNRLDVVGSFGRGNVITKSADFTLAATENWVVNNKAGATCTVTMPSAATFNGREIHFQNNQAQTLVSNASNVVPKGGGGAATAILPATATAWAVLVSNGSNWVIMLSGT